MDLSTLNPLQQGTLFSLLILGHAFPIFATISLFRVWKFRSALKDHSSKEKKQTVPEIPTLQAEEKQMACDKGGALSVKVIDKAIVREVQSDVLSPSEPAGSYNGYGFIVVTDPRHPNQNRKVTSIIADKKDVGNRKAHNSSLSFWLKGMVQRAANHLSYRDSINCEEPGEVEYRALFLTAVLIIFYYIGFLILGVVGIGLWSKLVRPDIPREDEASPFWAGAFLATSALCNNGMSLIDTNMGPYQKECVIRPMQKTICQGFR